MTTAKHLHSESQSVNIDKMCKLMYLCMHPGLDINTCQLAKYRWISGVAQNTHASHFSGLKLIYNIYIFQL